MKDPKSYDALSGAVFLVGFYEGLLSFVCKLSGWHPFLAFPTRLSTPACLIVSGAVIVAAVVLLDRIDKAKKRAHPKAG